MPDCHNCTKNGMNDPACIDCPGPSETPHNHGKTHVSIELSDGYLVPAEDAAGASSAIDDATQERDRELRESRMTPEQRIAESRKRQSDLERQLADEADPEKRMALREKIMDERERQAGLMDETERQAGLMEKPERKSLSIGDVFERMYGQDKAKDPAREQVDLLRDVKLTLEKIEKKKGGMAP